MSGARCLFWGLFAEVATYGDFKVDHLLGESGHLVVEAEGVFAVALRSEDVVALSLLCSIQDDLAARRSHGVVDIEGAARLNLMIANVRLNRLNCSTQLQGNR
jgi:hypothetical protein